MKRRLVDIVAEDGTLEIEYDSGTSVLRMAPLGRACPPHPFGATVWVVPLGEPEFPEDDTVVGRIEAIIQGAGGFAGRGRLSHPDWELPVVTAIGVPEARIRWIADGVTPIILRWSPDGLVVEALDEDEGIRTGSFELVTRQSGPPAPASYSVLPEQDRLATIAARRALVSRGPWGGYRPHPGVPLELVSRVPHPPAVQPKAAYVASGPWNRWRSTPGNVEFQADALADVMWLFEFLESSGLALSDAEERRVNAIRVRVVAAGEPGWVSPSPTAVHNFHEGSVAGQPGTFSWPKWDQDRQAPVPEAPLNPLEAARARFLEHAADDVEWLLAQIARLGASGSAGRRLRTEAPVTTGAEIVISFPPDRSLGDLDIGAPGGGRPEPAGPARGYVTIPAGLALRLRAGSTFRAGDLAYLTGLPHGTVNTVFLGGSPVGDHDLAIVGKIAGLRGLELSQTAITDEGLVHLSALAELRSLDLSRTHVTDAGLRHLSRLSELRSLDLSATKLTDAGLLHLTGLRKLERLVLFSCIRVGDRGLRHLLGLIRLEVIDLEATAVTEEGLEPLWALPRLRHLEATPGWI